MKKITAILFISLLFLFSVNSASAFTQWPFQFDLTKLPDIDGTPNNHYTDDGLVETMLQISYDALTRSTIENLGVPGSTVTDAGRAYSTALTFVSGDVPGDNEGHFSEWGLTFVWSDLTGTIDTNDGNIITASYTSGTFDFYVDYDPYAINTNNLGTYIDGTKVMTVEVTSGGYSLNLAGTGTVGSSYTLFGKVTDLPVAGFLLDGNGNAVTEGFAADFLRLYTAGDNDPNSVTITTVGTNLIVDSDHNASFEFNPIPEPATLTLLGIGLLGLTAIGRRKRN